LREARAAARVRHPDIVHVHQVGLTNGLCYMVMEWLQGRDLADELEQRGALPLDEAIKITLDALSALAEAHRSGIVHKDLKPSNLFLWTDAQRRRRVKVLDFGVAHLAAEESVRLTRTGRPACTPAYAAPEYLMRLLVTPAIDVYQMGLILIELLTGQRAVPHELPLECINAHLHGWIEIPDHLGRGPLGAVLRRAINKDHMARYPDAEAFAVALREASRALLPQATAALTPPPPIRGQRAAAPRDAGRLTAPQDAQIIEAWRALDRLITLHRAQSTDYKALIALLRVCLDRAPWPTMAPEWQDLELILTPLHRATRHAPADLRHTLDLLRRQLERHLGRPLNV
jgi:serine/threonine protein kinase